MKIFILLFLFVFDLSIKSQTDSIASFNMPEMKIYQEEKGKQVIYKFDDESIYMIITPDLLIADTSIYKYRVSLKDIPKISIRNGTHFWSGAAVGGIIGFVLGFAFGGNLSFSIGGGGNDHPFNPGAAIIVGLIVAIPIGLIGGLLGMLSPNYDEYKVFNINGSKYQRLIKIFRRNKL